MLSVHMSAGAPHTQWLWQSFKKRVLSCPPQDGTLNTSLVLVLPNKPLETVSQRVVTEEKAPPTEVSIVRQSDGAPTCLKTENFTGWHGGVSLPCQLSCFAGCPKPDRQQFSVSLVRLQQTSKLLTAVHVTAYNDREAVRVDRGGKCHGGSIVRMPIQSRCRLLMAD